MIETHRDDILYYEKDSDGPPNIYVVLFAGYDDDHENFMSAHLYFEDALSRAKELSYLLNGDLFIKIRRFNGDGESWYVNGDGELFDPKSSNQLEQIKSQLIEAINNIFSNLKG